ncbi:MAG: hypothetical protein K0S27_1609 [Gammaproteobacteria bacterium]|jgi:putative lipoic acid-binding regulatory protein|nr:hypothetical protein [Gammaproteobacteria bacterium]
MDKQTPTKPSPSNEAKGLDFPCEFIIKIFGHASEKFENDIFMLIKNHQPSLSKNAIKNRLSKDGKFLALSITLQVESQEQLDSIYRELTANSSVLMAL